MHEQRREARSRRSIGRMHGFGCWVAFLSLTACYQPADSAALSAAARGPTESHAWSLPDAGGTTSNGDELPGLLLRFHVLTAPLGGRFAPNNVGAIWIESEAGEFVRTLAVWGRTRAQYLRRFQAAARGNVLDAVTGATLLQHTHHELTWDFRGVDRAPRDARGTGREQEVEDANYRLIIELTDKNSTGVSLELPFVKNGEPALLMPPDTAQFREMELAIEGVESR